MIHEMGILDQVRAELKRTHKPIESQRIWHLAARSNARDKIVTVRKVNSLPTLINGI